MNINLNGSVDSLAVNPRVTVAKSDVGATRTPPAADRADAADPTRPVESPAQKPDAVETRPAPPMTGPFDGRDLATMVQHWGEPGTSYDFDANGTVNVDDLLYMIENWEQLSRQSRVQLTPTPTPGGDAATDTAMTEPLKVPSETRVEPAVERPLDVKVETRVETRAETSVETRVETKPDIDVATRPQPAPTNPTFSDDDLQNLVESWGKADTRFDFDLDGMVDIDDMLYMLQHWEAPSTTAAEDTRSKRLIASVDTERRRPGNSDPVVKEAPAHRDANRIADRLIERLSNKGFESRPPTNIREILDRLDLEPADRRVVLSRLREQYPDGLGINMQA